MAYPPKLKNDKPPKEGYRRLGNTWLSPEEYKRYERWLNDSDAKVASYWRIQQQLLGR